MNSVLETIMADLMASLKMIPGVQAVIDEPPREDVRDGMPFARNDLPCLWVWEGVEAVDATQFTNRLVCTLPVTVEAVFSADADGNLRREGRRLKAAIQYILGNNIGRGLNMDSMSPNAVDTIERENVIGPLPERGYGVVHLEYDITYHRGINNPYGAEPLLGR